MTAAGTGPDKFFGWKALSVAAVMYFAMTGLLLYSFPVFLPFLYKAFGWSRASISWANSLAMIFVLLVVLPSFLVINKPEDLGQVPDKIRAGDKKDSSPDMKNLYGTPVDFTAAEAIRTSAFWYLTILATTIGSIGSPLTGWIYDITGSYKLAWKLAIVILTIGLVSLILARPPVHPSIRENRAISG